MGKKTNVIDNNIRTMLSEEVPFRFLSPAQREALLENLTLAAFGKGETVFKQGEESDDVFLLAVGLVEISDPSVDPPQRISRIVEGRYFGERASLFDEPRDYSAIALESSQVYILPGHYFLNLIHTSRSFAQSMGTILRDRQGIFSAFDTFSAELMRGISLGTIDIRTLLPLYQELEPALHPGSKDTTLNTEALGYAVSRLPRNVTRNFVYFLTDDLPFEFSQPDKIFLAVPSEARRRNIWEMLPGKSMVLLRSGLSDLIDFITCLCVYSVEARKIRKHIGDPDSLLSLTERLDMLDHDGRPCDFSDLPFSKAELHGLQSVWPGEVPIRIRQIALHREALSVDISRQTQSYNSRRTDIWTYQVSNATRQLIGFDPSDLPGDLRVHIISSNTHSVTNCLNPFLIEYSDEIIEWARHQGHADAGQLWRDSQDMVYSVARDYMLSNPEMAMEHVRDEDWGILRLRETVSTGIQVQLIDLKKLRGYALDPALSYLPDDPRALIINIDYAFGEQAEEIIRNLIMLFGCNVGSINVLGKAGSLVGSRGDILAPTAFIEQTTDSFYPFAESVVCSYPDLGQRIPERTIHRGPLLTVAGTLLQNRQMLNFYRHVWSCVGLEMEGSYYFRQIVESEQLGVIPSDIPMRFLYYVSDLPLNRKADLSAHLSSEEGIPPLYAITRQIISDIFNQERARL